MTHWEITACGTCLVDSSSTPCSHQPRDRLKPNLEEWFPRIRQPTTVNLNPKYSLPGQLAAVDSILTTRQRRPPVCLADHFLYLRSLMLFLTNVPTIYLLIKKGYKYRSKYDPHLRSTTPPHNCAFGHFLDLHRIIGGQRRRRPPPSLPSNHSTAAAHLFAKILTPRAQVTKMK